MNPRFTRIRRRGIAWLGLACLALPTAAAAADEAAENAITRGWTCSLCPGPAGSKGRLDIGTGYVSDAAARYGDYRGLPDDGSFLALAGQWRMRGTGGRFVDARADQVGLDSRSFKLRTGVRGRYVVTAGYRETPRYRGVGTETAYLGVGGGFLSLPPDWIPAGRTSDMPGLETVLAPVDLAINRQTFDLGLTARLGGGWTWDTEIEHQRKRGTRPIGAGVFLLNASHFPAPVEFDSTRAETGIAFNGQKGHWRLAYQRSDFENRAEALSWPNPFTPLPGTEWLRVSLEPDSQAERVRFAGAWTPTPWLRLNGSASAGSMEQNAILLPASSNPGFMDVPLPRDRAGTRVDTTTLNTTGSLNARLSTRLSLVANWRQEQRDNRSPVELWTPIITDAVQREPRPNRPYSFSRERSTVTLRYRTPFSSQWQIGGVQEDRDRTLQAVDTTRERGLWTEFSSRAFEGVEGRIRFERNDRSGSDYLQPADGGPEDHPLLRKFHLADREERRSVLDLVFHGLTGVTFSGRYERTRADYRQPATGLEHGDRRSLDFEVGLSVGEHLSLAAFASQEVVATAQNGMQAAAQSAWRASTQDRFTTAGLEIGFQSGRRLELRTSLIRTDTQGDIRVLGRESGQAFPSLETRMVNAQFEINYRIRGPWALRAWLEHERYSGSDWALGRFEPDDIPAVLSLGPDFPRYHVTTCAVQVRYTF